MQDEFDVISHNLQVRMNYDTDMSQSLYNAKTTQKLSSGFKAFIVLFMCGLQTYFITCIFGTKQAESAPKSTKGSSVSRKAVAAKTATKADSAKSESNETELSETMLEMV